MKFKENQGLIPRICKSLFSRMEAGKQNGISFRTEVSYLEIYQERVMDLLRPQANHSLRVREHPKKGPYVEDLTKCLVTDYGHIQVMNTCYSYIQTFIHNIYDTVIVYLILCLCI